MTMIPKITKRKVPANSLKKPVRRFKDTLSAFDVLRQEFAPPEKKHTMSKKKQKPTVEEFRRWVILDAKGKAWQGFETYRTKRDAKREIDFINKRYPNFRRKPHKPARAICRIEVVG